MSRGLRPPAGLACAASSLARHVGAVSAGALNWLSAGDLLYADYK